MKAIIAAILLTFSVSAFAYDVFVMKNLRGGEIVLTDKKCPVPDSKDFLFAYTWAEEIRILGCWMLVDKTVHVVWDAPQGPLHKEYDATEFTLKRGI